MKQPAYRDLGKPKAVQSSKGRCLTGCCASSQRRSRMLRAGLPRANLYAGVGEAQTGAAPSWSARCKGWRLVKEAAVPKNERFGRKLLSKPAPRLGAETGCHQIPWATRPDPAWLLQPSHRMGTARCAMTSQIPSLC